jgi:large subunit ribosomal protein L29|uniref:ribosomal protein L29 n=1 Tax=Ulnaria ulna TaxID=426669 RepID=UPI0027A8FEE7|nr:ribosomal protein L29 [Ulnaria ulna]WGN98807.1 ribosomal protein L29 [Ulnaria ulna]
MSLPKFNNLISLSNNEIAEQIVKAENEIFNLRFKKATRQTFKPHEIKKSKRILAQLKTLLSMRIEESENNEETVINQLIPN